MRHSFLKSALTGVAMLCASAANALTVDFDGVAFNQGGSATFVHNASTLWKLSANAPVTYEWTETTGLQGATAVFGGANAPLSLNLSKLSSGPSFDAVLKLGVSGSSNNTFTVGASAPLGTANGTPLGDVPLTHKITGSLNYQFEDTSGNLLGTGVFTFNDITSGPFFNRIGRVPSSASDIVAFVWGSAGTVNTSNCASVHCTEFSGLTGGLGMDLAFTGSVALPEPATVALLGLGLLGIGARRRRA